MQVRGRQREGVGHGDAGRIDGGAEEEGKDDQVPIGRHEGPLSGTTAERTPVKASRDAFKGLRVDGAEGTCTVTHCWNLYVPGPGWNPGKMSLETIVTPH
jgi:hypothetical protein